MTPNNAKKLIAAELESIGLPAYKLTAKTFRTLDDKIFVSVHDWKPNPAASDLKKFAHNNGFCVQFIGEFVQS